ncbi:MAG: hypothetical protein WCI11_03430 [Candidatus Methylumidiphilus sp.]
MNDLWAEDIATEKVRTPVAILREQASLLGKKTQNVVLAEVVTSAGSRFHHRFNITAPALGDYSYTLFSINHPIGPYPLEVDLDDDIAKELGKSIDRNMTIENEADFINLLNQILKAERTKHIIRILLAQSSE